MATPNIPKDPSHVQLFFAAHAFDQGAPLGLGLAAPLSGIERPPVAVPRAAAPAESVSVLDSLSEQKIKELSIGLDALLRHLKDFKVEQIELWIRGAVETKGILQLAIAAKGEGGVKIQLKPKA